MKLFYLVVVEGTPFHNAVGGSFIYLVIKGGFKGEELFVVFVWVFGGIDTIGG